MRTSLVRQTDVLRAQLEVLLLIEPHATPAPWDSRGSWVVAPSVPVVEARYDLDSYEYYGGELIGESIKSADAVLVSAARNLLPSLARAHLEALREIETLRRNLKFALLRSIDQASPDFLDLIRACGYSVEFRRKERAA